MYSKIKNIQILLSLLKQHGIRHIVLSAGTRHVPLAHSMENDSFFHCYSVVDERSAAYFAIGLSKTYREPVAVACTSSTATCNYTPAVAEAYYQQVPLLILTGDRDPYRLDQLEDQMINQVDMYRNFCRKCVTLPIVKDENDSWYCRRLVNEALLELDHHGSGPVQINFPINQSIEDIADASVPELPEVPCMVRLQPDREAYWADAVNTALGKKRILVICGSAVPPDRDTVDAMRDFAARYNAVFAVEALSNLHFPGTLDIYRIADASNVSAIRQLAPDLVIDFGGNYMSRIKLLLRGAACCETWHIAENGRVQDPFTTLTKIFECSTGYFFRLFADLAEGHANDGLFMQDLEELDRRIVIPDMEALRLQVNKYTTGDAKFKGLPAPTEAELIPEGYLSGVFAIRGLAERLPENSLVHTSILNSTRTFAFFRPKHPAEAYSNLGTDGIDGTMSTFLGQAYASDRPCYLIIGDLSFFYDMNSIAMRNIRGNVRILLVNNGGGAEFYFSMGPRLLPNIDLHISAAHKKRAKEWVEANGFRYYTARDQKEYLAVIDEFVDPKTDSPAILELFTEKERDVKMLKGLRRMIHLDSGAMKLARKIEEMPAIGKIASTPVGQSMKEKLKRGLRKFI